MKAILRIIIFFLLIDSVLAVGLVPARLDVDFEPGKTYEFEFFARADTGGETPVKVFMEGELSKYVEPKEYIKPSFMEILVPESGFIPFKFSVVIPDDAEPTPGENILTVNVADSVASTGNIAVTTAVRGWLVFNVPFPGKYAELSLDVTPVNRNLSTIDMKIMNKGKERLSNTRATVEIWDMEDNMVDTINFNGIDIKPSETKQIDGEIDMTTFTSARFKAKAFYFYDTKIAEADDSFRIGKIHVEILGHNNELIAGKINEIKVEIESFWNSQLDDVYIEGEIHGIEFKTPSVKLGGFKKYRLPGYIDATSMPTGEAELKLKAYYREIDSEDVYSSEYTGTIRIVDEVKAEATQEIPQPKVTSNKTLILAALLLVILAIVLFDIIWLRRRKRE